MMQRVEKWRWWLLPWVPVWRVIWRLGQWSLRLSQSGPQPRLPLYLVASLRMGGGGRTPVAQQFAQALQKKGQRVAILCYGVYGRPRKMPLHQQVWQVTRSMNGRQAGSDEALWHAMQSDIPVFCTRNRWKAWQQLEAKDQFDCLISDDGWEDPRLKAAKVMLLKSTTDFSARRFLFPAGNLRSLEDDHDQPWQTLCWGQDLVGMSHWIRKPLGGQRRVLVAGVGNPDRLEKELRQAQIQWDQTCRLPDHSRWLGFWVRWFVKRGAEVVVTGKDWVRLSSDLRNHPRVGIVDWNISLSDAMTAKINVC